MKIRLKIDRLWLELEKKSMKKLLDKYKLWEAHTLEKAKRAKDLRSLRELYYELGDRWEWDQVTGEWLSKGAPLDAIALFLRMPGLEPDKERYVLYAVMAYSKGFTDQFDHLGDKERVILERDLSTGKVVVWSTTGHGAMDLQPTDVSEYAPLENIVNTCHLVAQPGDHALRLCLPLETSSQWNLTQRLWLVASGNTEFTWRTIDVVRSEDIENGLGFNFYRYASAVISLEKLWSRLKKDKTLVSRDLSQQEIRHNTELLREIEGLLHVLWFKPPARQLRPAVSLYTKLKERLEQGDHYSLDDVVRPYLSELAESLTDLIEQAKFLKWKSVVEQKGYTPESIFDKLGITGMSREALVVALDDILKEHTLAYIGYPEKATMTGKVLRIILGLLVLPVRLVSAFIKSMLQSLDKLVTRFTHRESTGESEDAPSSPQEDQDELIDKGA
ncbi:MAG: hypothetical protein K9W43_04495 [Candidatus Thorarchaeota archaeon]|nr:hypothetical protein [Candidatus Thorarchaeota archaeon]